MKWLQKTFFVAGIVLTVIIVGVIIQSLYREHQAQAFAEELSALYVIAEIDSKTAQDKYISLLSTKWAIEDNAPILNIDFTRSEAYLPVVETDLDAFVRRGSGGGTSYGNSGGIGCPPDCYTLEEMRALSRMPISAFDPDRAGLEYRNYFNEAQERSGIQGSYDDLNFVLVNQPHLNVFGWKAAGFYNPSARTIFLPTPFLDNKEVVIHEMTHYLERQTNPWRLPIHGRAFRTRDR